jgi:hypothetical protein
VLAPWAQALRHCFSLHSYLAPDFYTVLNDQEWLLEKPGIEPGQWGKWRPINNGEVYTAKRYFARTDEIWPGHADVIATLDRTALENVIVAIRAAWEKKGPRKVHRVVVLPENGMRIDRRLLCGLLIR